MSLLGLALWACSGQAPDPDLVATDNSRPGSTAVRPIPDADGDTWTVAQGDCDDTDASVHPYADDPCDGIDSDCDGDLEPDADGDGYRTCAECDDSDAATWPHAQDPLDGVDNDCDGTDGIGLHSDGAVFGTVACGEFGWSVGAIDADGDGVDEVVVGAPRYQGCGVGWDQVVLSTTELILDQVEGNSILKGWQVDPFYLGTAPMVAVANGGYPPGGAVEVYTLTGGTFGGTPVLFVEGTPRRSTGDIGG